MRQTEPRPGDKQITAQARRYPAWSVLAAGIIALFAIFAAFHIAAPEPARADEGWVIRSFDVQYTIQQNGLVSVVEDIRVDFGTLERRGIFREMPVRYHYDDENDRLISVHGVSVDNGQSPWRFDLFQEGGNLRIRIGDPDITITGPQRYRISYTLNGALNPFSGHDEFFWNVTGLEWPVPIEQATATVSVPGSGIQQIACYQGPRGSQEPCLGSHTASDAEFGTTRTMSPGSGITIVVGLDKGAVDVGAPVLVSRDSGFDLALPDWFKFNGWVVAAIIAIGVAGSGGLARLWWTAGRDRWFGDAYHLHDELPEPAIRPLFARETVVVEYQPPEIRRKRRRLRPAEIGLLLDERADTLDVSATIIDLAVRGYIRIEEQERTGLFAAFQTEEHELFKLKEPEPELLPYESLLMSALFAGRSSVKTGDLKEKFHEDLKRVKDALYSQAVKYDNFFPQNPETVRNIYRVAGLGVLGAGVAAVYLLGEAFGAALVGVPVALLGLALVVLAGAMPRRTAFGRKMYRRSLGFRHYMVTAETERQRFAEESGIFHEYLPYAIVFGCVERWARVFQEMGVEPREPSWYVGARSFETQRFASRMRGFSSGVSIAMASTPGGSGGSGFGGGGGSGGGGGGGGGGSW